MKIKFLKEYKFLRGFENDVKFTTTQIFKDATIDTVEDEVPDEDVQWLIDNGFAEEVKKSGWWKPKYGDRYYFIDDSGYTREDVWGDNFWDVDRYKLGNVFKTEEAAERYRDYMEAIATVRQDEGVLTPEEVKKLEKCDGYLGDIYSIAYTCREGTFVHRCDLNEEYPTAGVIHFDTKKHAQASLEKHPDEWKIIANYDWSRE